MQSQQAALTSPMRPAPLWRRLAAITYDSFLVISLSFLVGFINLGILMKVHGAEQLKIMTDSGESLDSPAFYAALILTVFSFFAYFWTHRGQTLGMQAWRIHILNNNGSKITIRQALIRFLVAIPSILTGCLGILWVLWDSNRKSWQDYASGSGTYHLPRQQKK